jgi:GNAT superfamily N-acetyltransferase
LLRSTRADGGGIRVHQDPPADLLAIVDAGLGEANAAAAPLHEVHPLACAAHDASGRLIGGAVGRTWGACAELQQLWVEPASRRQGQGAALLRAFERAAAARGARLAYLETFSFQAPALYRRAGWQVALAIEGFAPGIVKLVMTRALDEA